MATQVGEAVIKLKFDGKNVKAELQGVEKEVDSRMSKSGKSGGGKWGMAWAVAAGNMISKGISKVASMVSGTMDKAISRLDTLNNFPKVMESLGYSAEASSQSIKMMDEGLNGLPTSLDAMASDVQKLAASMGNLADGEVNATSVGLALNDMFIAGGKGTEAASAAMEQYNQMLARGKVDQQSWNSMVNASPGQMNQLAESLLGAGKNQADLYKAMQKGTVTFDQFNAAIVKLDKEGGDGFASLHEQAVAATDGIQTQLQNVQTSWTKIVTDALGGNFDAMEGHMTQLVDRLTAIVPTIVNGFSAAVGAGMKVLPEIIEKLLPAVIQGAGTLIEGILDAVPDFITVLDDALRMIGDAVINALPNILKELSVAIGEIIFRLIDIVMEFLPKLINALADALPALTGQVVKLIEDLGRNLPAMLFNLGEALVNALPTLMDAVVRVLNAIVEQLPKIIPMLVAQITNIVITLAQTLTRPDLLSALLKAWLTLWIETVKAIPQIITAIVDALPQIIENIVAFLTDPNNIGMVLSAAGQLFMGIVMAIPQILGSLLGAFGSLIGSLWNWISSTFTEFAANFGNLIGGVFKGAINGVLSFIEGFINAPIDLLNGFIGIINDTFGWIGVNIGYIGRINLPRLAQGGIVDSATTAIIGEDGQEAVLPLENNTGNWAGLLAQTLAAEMQEQGNSGTINVYMTNQIDNRLDAQDIGRVMMESIRRAA